jgi:hypothetical protein
MSNLSNIPVTLNFDFNQFLLFFEQLPMEHKKLILQSLEKQVAEKKGEGEKWESLKSSVLHYQLPFEPIAAEDWEVLQ